MKPEAPIYSLWRDITRWILDRIDDFPKKVRFSLSNRVANLTLDILEQIIEALYKRKKILILRDINLKIEKLRVLLQICFNRNYLSTKQYEYIQEKLFEAGCMIGGWLKLVDIFSRTVQDDDVLWLLRTILATGEPSSGVKGKGLPIGNQTSQFLANVYLNKLDHFAVKNLSMQCYTRYMDDIVIFHPDKERLKTVRDRLTQFAGKELLLKVKERATVIQGRENGLGFLGYRVFPGLIRVKNKNIKKLKRKVSLREKQFKYGKIGQEQLAASVQSILGYFNFANAGHLKRHIFAGA
jgi:hypothetical protein